MSMPLTALPRDHQGNSFVVKVDHSRRRMSEISSESSCGGGHGSSVEKTATEEALLGCGGGGVAGSTTGGAQEHMERIRREKRLAMNRDSARARRKRKKDLLNTLQDKLEKLEAQNHQYLITNQRLEAKVEQLEKDHAMAQSTIALLSSQKQSSTTSPGSPPPQARNASALAAAETATAVSLDSMSSPSSSTTTSTQEQSLRRLLAVKQQQQQNLSSLLVASPAGHPVHPDPLVRAALAAAQARRHQAMAAARDQNSAVQQVLRRMGAANDAVGLSAFQLS